MREALIYALAMGLLAFGGGFSGPPLPVADASGCVAPCGNTGGHPASVTKF